MDNDIHAVHSSHKPFTVTHVANKIAQRRMVISMHFHFVLLQFIPAEDNDLLRLFFLQRDLREFFAERPCPAGDEYGLIFPVHVNLSVRYHCEGCSPKQSTRNRMSPTRGIPAKWKLLRRHSVPP